MVARLSFTAKLSSVLDYNEQKVAQNDARLIHVQGFLQHPELLTLAEKTERFARLNALNNRSKVNMLHATLNFDRSDMLSVPQLAAIADRYMQGLGMEQQPYLVYQHLDAGHPHLHIVSSIIRPDGTRLKDNHIGRRLSAPTRKLIEKEFGLHPAAGRKRVQPTPGPPMKIVYGKAGPHQPAMENVIGYVLKHYNVTSLAEFNAVLRGYNLIADPGGPRSRTRQTEGLTYRITDEHGRKKSAPVKASDFASQPTITRLEKTFEQHRKIRSAEVDRLEQRLARVAFQSPDSLRAFSAELQNADIELVLHQDRQGGIRNLVYIDQGTRLAVDAARLSRDFLTPFIADTNKPTRGEQLSLFPPQTLPLLPGFSTQSPHLLSQLVDHPHFDPPDEEHTQEQQLQPRHRH